MTPPRGAGPPSFAVRLGHDVNSPARARALVRELMTTAGEQRRTDVVADAMLVVQELVSNAVMHGTPDRRGDIEVSGRIDHGDVVLSVVDGGTSGTVEALPFTPEDDHGRGLAIVAALSAAWDVDRTRGTRVTARITL